MTVFHSIDRESIRDVELHPIKDHPTLLRLEQPDGQHLLLTTCMVCREPELLENTFEVGERGRTCMACYAAVVNAYMATMNDDHPHERAQEYQDWLRELDPPSVTDTMRRQVFVRDGHTCRYCGATTLLSVDHVIPQSRGGNHGLTNLVTACRSCNSRKYNRTPDEAGMVVRVLTGRPA